jgi:anaerobic selenocysteine-containing dehydrogenase
MGERMQGFTGVRGTTRANCMPQCGVLVHLEDGRVTKITGTKDHPLSQGFICITGARAVELHYDPRRIHRPLRHPGATFGTLMTPAFTDRRFFLRYSGNPYYSIREYMSRSVDS